MNKVSESIWSNEDLTIPMVEVSFIESVTHGIQIVMKHSKWQDEYQHWSPMIVISNEEEAKEFIRDWCFYRHEIEGSSEAFKETED